MSSRTALHFLPVLAAGPVPAEAPAGPGDGPLPEGALFRFGSQARRRRRLERLLEKALARKPAPETLRALRALAVLEYLDTPDARRLLRRLAEGDPDALLTREAKAVLRRVARRDGTP